MESIIPKYLYVLPHSIFVQFIVNFSSMKCLLLLKIIIFVLYHICTIVVVLKFLLKSLLVYQILILSHLHVIKLFIVAICLLKSETRKTLSLLNNFERSSIRIYLGFKHHFVLLLVQVRKVGLISYRF